MMALVALLAIASWSRLLADRLWVPLTTLPPLSAWMLTAGWGLGFGAIALLIGFGTGFLQIDLVRDRRIAIPTALVAFIYPGIAEEVLFRALPLPITPDVSPRTLAIASGLSLVIFIAAHPLNALIFFPTRKATFFDPIFLGLAGLLGLVCTLSYLHSRSLWPPIVLHWAIVVIWLLTLGGYRRMAGAAESEPLDPA